MRLSKFVFLVAAFACLVLVGVGLVALIVLALG